MRIAPGLTSTASPPRAATPLAVTRLPATAAVATAALAALLLLTAATLLAAPAGAQSLQLRLADTGASQVTARVGDTLTVEVTVDLGDLRAAGVALHVQLPDHGLVAVVDGRAAPFRAGLFAAGVEFANEVVPAGHAWGLPPGTPLLTYAVVLGPGATRFRDGAGAIATFDVVCTAPVDGDIRLFDSPVYASKVVLDDGRTELDLVAAGGLRLSVAAEAAARRAGGSWAALKAHVTR